MSKWNDLINRYNPNEDDLCDLLDAAEKVGRDDVIDDAMKICKDCNKCQFSIFFNGYYKGCALLNLKEQSE